MTNYRTYRDYESPSVFIANLLPRVCVRTHARVCDDMCAPLCASGGQRTTYRSHSSPSTV